MDLSGIQIDLTQRQVTRDGEVLRLTSLEVKLLRYMAARGDQVVPREDILVEVWGYHPEVETRAIDNAIKRLRVKIERTPKAPSHLKTIFGAGYSLEGARGPQQEASDDFVGRTPELASLAALLAPGEHQQLVTLVGPGGGGKTRLARRFGDHSRRTVCFCDLSPARSQEDMTRLVAGALGVPLTGAAPLEAQIAQIGRALAGRGRGLLILDNVEQILSPAASLVQRWRALAGESALLVTSRSRLGIAGEQVVAVGPLSADEAATLFRERATLVGATVADTPALRQLLEVLDRLPLAIELAAARCALMPVASLLERLTQHTARPVVLRSRRRDLPPRQSTMWATIAWSWELLDDWERSALAQCAVFPSSFDLEAAEAVLGVTALDALETLLEASLLTSSAAPHKPRRFRLFESVRAFALQQSPEERAEASARHREHYTALGQTLSGRMNRAGGLAALERLALEAENLLAAHRSGLESAPGSAGRAAMALDALWHIRGPLQGQLELLDATLAVPIEDASLRARLLGARAAALRHVGRHPQSLTDLEEGLALARGAGDTRLECSLLRHRADTLITTGAVEEGEQVLEAALALARGDTWAEAAVLTVLGRLHRIRGDYERGVRRSREGLTAMREVGNSWGESIALQELALCLTDRGEATLAVKHMEEVLAIMRSLNSSDIGGPLLYQGLILQQRWSGEGLLAAARDQRPPPLPTFDLVRARAVMETAVEEHRRMGRVQEEAIVLGNLGAVCHVAGDFPAAQRHLERAARAVDRPASRRLCGWFTALGAISAAEAGHLPLARSLQRDARERLEGDPSQASIDTLCDAAVAAGSGDPGAARAALQALSEGDPSPLLRFGVTHMAAEMLLAQLQRAGAGVR